MKGGTEGVVENVHVSKKENRSLGVMKLKHGKREKKKKKEGGSPP